MATVSEPAPRLLQQLDALTKARASTQSRARLTAQFRALDREQGCRLAVELLDDLPGCLLTLEAWRFVSLIRNVQPKTWRAWLVQAGAGERCELRKISDRQRDSLKAAIGSYGLAAA